jgi:hypothetical protein
MDTLKIISASLLILLGSCYHQKPKTQVRECRVINVKKIERSTIEAENCYKITTSCGFIFVDKDRYKIGDTIIVESR